MIILVEPKSSLPPFTHIITTPKISTLPYGPQHEDCATSARPRFFVSPKGEDSVYSQVPFHTSAITASALKIPSRLYRYNHKIKKRKISAGEGAEHSIGHEYVVLRFCVTEKFVNGKWTAA